MIYDKFSLAGKVAIVTGAGRGIGRSIALALAEAGANVAVAARTRAQVDRVAREVEDRGRLALSLTVDVANVEDIEQMIQRSLDTFGRIDVLINSAGTSPYYTGAENITPAMWDEILAVNLRGLFFCCQAAGRVMIKQGGGSIVNVSSAGGIVGSPRLAAYTASKGGVILLTKTLALEWALQNVRVNALAPGWVATEFTRGLRENPQLLQLQLKDVPMGRMSEPDEIAGAALFLASEASSYITGAVIMIDGGATA